MKKTINELREELREVRAQALQASREGDWMKIARMTNRAAQINKAIFDYETEEESIKFDFRGKNRMAA